MKIYANFEKSIGKLEHFWKSTGFAPADLLLNPVMKQASTYEGSIPGGGITHVRVHNMLDLVKVQKMDTDSPEYDWSILDKALELLILHHLKPFFEVMRNPSGYFDDFLDKAKVYAWRRFIRDLALHCIERYGEEEVTSWYFESWNEPDINWLKVGTQAFLNYYDASSEGLKEADSRLIFGGPGTSRTLSNFFTELLQHCDEGLNYFTGEKGVRIDFISVHEKGADPNPEDINPDTQIICDHEIKAIEYIRKEHPRLSKIPFMNNECDPQIGWDDYHTWHGRPYYAAIVCKMINQHLTGIVDKMGCDYKLLSNDNGFIGRWGHRTLFAYFGEEPHQTEIDLKFSNKDTFVGSDLIEKIQMNTEFSLIKKPVFNAMIMLSLLGNIRCKTDIPDNKSDNIGVIATKNGEDQISILIYNSSDKIMNGGIEKIDLSLEGLSFNEACLVHYRIDEEHGDPYNIWEKNGARRIPNEEVLAEMKENQELVIFDEVKDIVINDGKLDMSFDLPLTGVSLILLSRKPEVTPQKVFNIRTEKYKSVVGKTEIMLFWDINDSKFIKTYEVLFSDKPDGIFVRVNKQDFICSAYSHTWSENFQKGYYKIKAVDYWGCSGEESEIIKV